MCQFLLGSFTSPMGTSTGPGTAMQQLLPLWTRSRERHLSNTHTKEKIKLGVKLLVRGNYPLDSQWPYQKATRPKAQTSLLFLCKSQAQEQHHHINMSLLLGLSSLTSTPIRSCKARFLLLAPSSWPADVPHQRTPTCGTRVGALPGWDAPLAVTSEKQNRKGPLTAPSMILKISHRKPQMTMPEGGVCRGRRERVHSGQRNIPRNPVSSSCDSHPGVPTQEKQKRKSLLYKSCKFCFHKV